MRAIELVYFSGCPNMDLTRGNLREALDSAGVESRWVEWDQLDAAAPEWVRRYGSPTVLVNGRDVAGGDPGDAVACRATGAPSVQAILAAIGGPE